jgi:hypothetical protein
MKAKKTQEKRNLTKTELRQFQLALGKIRVKAYKMSQNSKYNQKAKNTLLRIEKSIYNITNNVIGYLD